MLAIQKSRLWLAGSGCRDGCRCAGATAPSARFAVLQPRRIPTTSRLACRLQVGVVTWKWGDGREFHDRQYTIKPIAASVVAATLRRNRYICAAVVLSHPPARFSRRSRRGRTTAGGSAYSERRCVAGRRKRPRCAPSSCKWPASPALHSQVPPPSCHCARPRLPKRCGPANHSHALLCGQWEIRRPVCRTPGQTDVQRGVSSGVKP